MSNAQRMFYKRNSLTFNINNKFLNILIYRKNIEQLFVYRKH